MRINKFFKGYILFVLLSSFITGCNSKEKNLSIIPKPVIQKQLKGKFLLGNDTKVVVGNNELQNSGDFLKSFLNEKYGIKIEVTAEIPEKNYIQLTLTDKLKDTEGYQLTIGNNSVEVIGNTSTGIFYGIQTLMQLFPPLAQQQKQIVLNAASIEDFPRFRWRGLHLDVSRHFFSVEFIKNLLDVMAMHKLNIFHWHLTDDQGWRIEIQKYSKLTEIGAWRDSTILGHLRQYPPKYEKKKYGGYYTQKEIKEIVQYAKERHITVVPEIDMPGHFLAALAAYPQFSCTGGPFSVATEWGVFLDVLCAGKEKTFHFIENILDEVIPLFPGEYIHIGGDEVLKNRWRNCEYCQRRIKEEGLKDENELQSYFIKRVENYLYNKGKQVIGWDEIIAGGLPERAIVMSWRGMEGGIKAVKSHNYAIMAPWTPCYFYVYQGKYKEPQASGDINSLRDVYEFDAISDILNEDEKKYILGGHGCAWSEYMPSEEIAEYMIFPRLSALSEALWTEKSQKNWNDFVKRMDDQYNRLDYHNINYRVCQ